MDVQGQVRLAYLISAGSGFRCDNIGLDSLKENDLKHGGMIMLVLTRKIGESLVIDGEITIKVSQIQGNRVRLCIDAPKSHRVIRSEIQKDDVPAPIASRPVARADAAKLVPTNAK